MNGRDVTAVGSVREISRLCECTWAPAYQRKRVAGWRLSFAARACRFHGATVNAAAAGQLAQAGRER